MVEQKPADKTFQDLADKIQAELPEELSLATHFSVDEKHERLLLDFAVHLEKNDYPLVLGIVKKFNGDFGNRKEGGKDVGYFFVPKPKPANPTPSTPAAVKPSEEKKPKVPKQPSPISQFVTNYCEFCADYGDKCNSTTVSGREVRMICLRILSVKELQSFNDNLQKLYKIISQPRPAQVQPSPTPATQHPQSEKVHRDTHPTEGHREGDIVWINASNQKGEAIEKALVKDNSRSNDYGLLHGRLIEAEKAGKKGFADGGKWYWLSNQGDYIGRKPAKTFGSGRP